MFIRMMSLTLLPQARSTTVNPGCRQTERDNRRARLIRRALHFLAQIHLLTLRGALPLA
jgi:hypothetical protein